MKVAESTLIAAQTFDSAQAQLNALTGASDKHNLQVLQIANTHRLAGVGIEQSAQALGNLRYSMTGFTDLAPEMQNKLTASAAAMERFGISGDQTAEILDNLTKGIGMTAQQASDAQQDLLKTALAMELPPKAIIEGFSQAMPHLITFGKEAPKIFAKVAAASKKLGVEMSTLIDFSQQFDTFEGAASAVGKLNALLGGDVLNSYEMMNANANERNEMLLRGIELSGQSWSSMNRFLQMSIANAAGINDMTEANKLFGGGLAAYREAQREMSTTLITTEQLAEAQRDAIGVWEKLKLVVEAFAVVVAPIVYVLHGLAEVVLLLSDYSRGWIPIILSIIAVTNSWTIVTGALRLAMYALGLIIKPFTISLGWLGTGLGAFGASGTASAKGIGIAALAITGLAASIGLLGAAMKSLLQMDAMESLFSSVKDVDAAAVVRVKGIVDLAERYEGIQADFKAPEKDAFLQALREINREKETKAATGGVQLNKDLVIKVGDLEFGRLVKPYIEEGLNDADFSK